MGGLKRRDEVNNIVVDENRENSSYLNLFDRKLSLRNACVNCIYSKKERIGDYWGYDYGESNNMYYPMSFICFQTDKSLELVDDIKKNFYLQPTDYNNVVLKNERLLWKSGNAKLNLKRLLFKLIYLMFGYPFTIKLLNLRKQMYKRGEKK